MKLYACLCFYRDGVKLLDRCLSSLKKNGIDEIIAVDGRYKEFPDKDDHSSFQEFQLVDSLCDITIVQRNWDTQMEKRNVSISFVPNGDYFLIIDADEELTTPIDKSKLTLDAYSVQMYEPQDGRINKQYPSNRIFKKHADLEFRNRHCALYRTSQMEGGNVYSGLVSRDLSIPFTDPLVVLNHYPHERSNERRLAGAIYKENRTSEIPVTLRGKENYEENKI